MKHLTPDQFDAFQERTVIMELNGGMAREEADRRALEELIGQSPERAELIRYANIR